METLISILRPSTTYARIRPSDLNEYRITHQMLGPCCLCPLVDVNGPHFVESTIRIVGPGSSFAGEYAATCKLHQCGYFGGPVNV
jgi:hypothetical protein